LRLSSRFSRVGSCAVLSRVRARRAAHWAGSPDASSLSLATQIACLIITVSYVYDTYAVVEEARRMMWDELRERDRDLKRMHGAVGGLDQKQRTRHTYSHSRGGTSLFDTGA
jgi:hypothetical protein